MFWVISVYFNIRNTLPKSGTFLLGHPVNTHTHTHTHTYVHTPARRANIFVNVCLNSKDVLLSVVDFWQKSVLLCGNGGDSKVDGSVLTESNCNAVEWGSIYLVQTFGYVSFTNIFSTRR